MRNIFLQTPAQSNFEQRNWMTRRVEVLLGLFAEKGVVSKWMISSHIKLIKYSSHPARETFLSIHRDRDHFTISATTSVRHLKSLLLPQKSIQ